MKYVSPSDYVFQEANIAEHPRTVLRSPLSLHSLASSPDLSPCDLSPGYLSPREIITRNNLNVSPSNGPSNVPINKELSNRSNDNITEPEPLISHFDIELAVS